MKDFDKSQLINKKRTLSRLFAVQCLYQYEFFKKEKNLTWLKEDLIENYTLFEDEQESSYRNKIDEKFSDNLLEKTLKFLDEIDADIQKCRKNDDVDILTNAIVRIGAVEMKFSSDIDYKIIINEYCDVAGCFYEDSKISFVSSVLNQLAKEYRNV